MIGKKIHERIAEDPQWLHYYKELAKEKVRKHASDYWCRTPNCTQRMLMAYKATIRRRFRRLFDKVQYRSKEKKYAEQRYKSVREKYGLMPEEYDRMRAKQKYCCRICGYPEELFGRLMSVDHSHQTGMVRGLLCGNCNMGLGKFKDSLRLVQNALEYLEEFYEDSNKDY